MGWFTVLKGAYPSLHQIDKSLPMATGETGITRGSLIYQDGSTFKLATAAVKDDPLAFVYFALMSQSDLTAGMAGTSGQGVAGGVPVLTGLACSMPQEVETDQFDKTEVYNIGDLLAPGADGKVTLHVTGDNVVGQVTKAAYVRYINDAVAVTGFRTGANADVLTFRTLWVPTLATA